MKNARKSLKIICGFIIIANLSAEVQGACVFWNRLESQTNVENSDYGLDGTFIAGSFEMGYFGNAYVANQNSDKGVTFPKEVIPWERGTLEFWAKLNDYPDNLAWGSHPIFVQARDSTATNYLIHLNGNDGAGGGGLGGIAGHNHATTGAYGSWTYEQVLGGCQTANWYHYALVWDKDGISGLLDGTKTVAVFLNGQLNTGRWYTSGGFAPLIDGFLYLVHEQSWAPGRSVAIDNIRIWDEPLTDLSIRCVEVPEPATVLLLGLGGMVLSRRRRG